MVKARQFEASSRIASVHAQPPSGAQVSGSGGAAGGELTTLTWQSASLASPHRVDPLQLVDAQQSRPSGQSAAVVHGVHGAVPKPYSDHCVEHQLVIAPPPVVVPVPPVPVPVPVPEPVPVVPPPVEPEPPVLAPPSSGPPTAQPVSPP